MLALPVIDARGFRADPASPAGRRFVRALRDACHGPGFCYLVGHGVAPRLDAAIMAGAARFFALPEAERHRIAIGNSPHFRGYTVLGDERTQGKSDWREQIDIGPEEPALRLRPGDPAYLRLRGPNQWPDDSYHLRTAAEEWMRAMHDVGLCVMRALALGLGQPADQFDDAILPRPYPRLKIIRYPAQEAAHEDDQGVGLHHDSGLLSFILQDDVGGLQVQTESGLVDAVPYPGAYVMNLGEMLQAATNGYLRATKHRVRSPPPGKQRVSIAYFFNPKLESVFTPLSLPAPLAAQAKGGQNQDPSDPVHETFGDNTLKIRMRAHPDVAARYYADRTDQA